MKVSEVNSLIRTEARTEELIDAERIEPFEALAEAREACRRIGRRKEFLRRRLEREHERRAAAAFGFGLGARQDRSMAEVQAVEDTDRHGARRPVASHERCQVSIEAHSCSRRRSHAQFAHA